MTVDRPLPPALTPEKLEAVRSVCILGAAKAGSAMSRLVGETIAVSRPEVTTLALGEVPTLFGGLNVPAVGVLIPFQGDVEGNALILFPEPGLEELVSLVFPRSRGEHQALLESAFAEMGNILTGTLLTVLSTLAERLLVSLPPLVVRDMAGAILDSVLAEIGARAETITALQFSLTGSTGESLVRSIFIPDQAGTELLLEAAERLRAAW